MTQVEQLKIFLASPSDVARERKYAQDVIHEINRVFAPSRGTVLDLITSERARPGYGKDGQAIINEQIGNMEEYDLFVGIMWNRIGTRTPRDISGTVEEFARAAKAAQRKQKPEIWFYFRQAPANLTTKDELAQREGVLEFRKKLRGKSLFRDYKTPLDFSNQLREHLLGWLEARSQKGSPGSGKTRRRPSDNGSNSVSSARIDRSKRPGDATNLKAALGMRKPAGKAPVKRAPAVTKNPGTWIMLDDHFFRTQSSNLEADRSIVLRIAPTSQGQTADLRSVHAGDLHRRREVPYADEHEAGITQVQSVTSQTSRGKTIFTVTLAPLPQLNRRGALSEFSYNSYSANTIAELRARWILLGQPLPKEIEHLAVSHQGRSVYRATGDLSIQTLPQLWASLGTQTQAWRAKGMAPNGKAPLLPAQLRQAIDALPDTLLGKRDHALLVIALRAVPSVPGFAGAFRRSELVALTMEDIQTTHEGLIVTLRRSKTDQEGQTMVRGLPKGTSEATCPVRVLQQWVTAAKITTGPIFRPVNRYGTVGKKALSGLAVPRIVKEALTRAGIDAKDYSGHSLRAGLVTAAAMAGVSERIIMLQTGHKNIAVLRRYICEGSVFRENAAAAVGL